MHHPSQGSIRVQAIICQLATAIRYLGENLPVQNPNGTWCAVHGVPTVAADFVEHVEVSTPRPRAVTGWKKEGIDPITECQRQEEPKSGLCADQVLASMKVQWRCSRQATRVDRGLGSPAIRSLRHIAPSANLPSGLPGLREDLKSVACGSKLAVRTLRGLFQTGRLSPTWPRPLARPNLPAELAFQGAASGDRPAVPCTAANHGLWLGHPGENGSETPGWWPAASRVAPTARRMSSRKRALTSCTPTGRPSA